MRGALEQLDSRFRAGRLNGTPLSPAQRERLSRRARVEELAELLHRDGQLTGVHAVDSHGRSLRWRMVETIL
jgi:hypothetical protein